MSETLYPLILKPAYKDYLWGGDKIIRYFKRDEPPGVYAESWEVSDRPEGPSVAANGPFAGKTLSEIAEGRAAELFGNRSTGGKFPLLIKLIDAKQKLSVQVHPDDESAARYGGEAKTEMWYVLDAEPGAYVYAGLKEGVDRDVFSKAIEEDTFEDVLVKIPVGKGDAVFMRGGRVHAIGEGCLLLEVQQNSNTTYRIYDWGRFGSDGKSRQMHIDEALQVIHWDDTESARVTESPVAERGESRLTEVLTTPYFRLERLDLHGEWEDECDGSTFHVLFVAEGEVRLKAGQFDETIAAGTSCLLPSVLGDYSGASAGAVLLRVSLP
ncbi:MAG: class I mannose-6-phosphate isomerase [Verrucomicrobia bacterium]|nr:class I mannose-6-phosphate isomerase [Verrucomicrobiota bacterium]